MGLGMGKVKFGTFFKYGCVVYQNDHIEKTKVLQLKILTSKVISRSFWGHKGQILDFFKNGCVIYQNEHI